MSVNAYAPYPVAYALDAVGAAKTPTDSNGQEPLIMHHCLHCLGYTPSKKVAEEHMDACDFSSIGEAVWSHGDIVIRKIDGADADNLAYIQCLCLLARNFLAHKVVLWNAGAGPKFNYYVMYKCDEYANHLVGFFSAPKVTRNNGRNLSCLLVLPAYQRMGYAQMLVDRAYQESVSRGECGGPERPFSEAGLAVYEKYWDRVVRARVDAIAAKTFDASVIAEIGKPLGLLYGDVVETLVRIGLLTKSKSTELYTETFIDVVGTMGREFDVSDIAISAGVDRVFVFDWLNKHGFLRVAKSKPTSLRIGEEVCEVVIPKK